MKIHKILLICLFTFLCVPLVAFSATTNHFNKTLKVGSVGKEVRDLQTLLTLKGFLPKKPSYISGTFGSKTKAALIKYQKDAGLTVTGKTDSLTRTILNADLLNLTLTSSSTEAAFKVPLLKACPEEKIENIQPASSKYHYTATAGTTTGYYIFKGERREVKEFDASWVSKNCTFPVNIVY